MFGLLDYLKIGGAFLGGVLIAVAVLCRSHWVEIRICPKADYERGCEIRKVP